MKSIRVFVFAHNESDRIERCLSGLLRQSVWSGGFEVSGEVICNGCEDDTAALAGEICANSPMVVRDWREPGKARSWNRVVGGLDLDFDGVLVFVDGDIEFVTPDAIERLAGSVRSGCGLIASSHATKDLRSMSLFNPARLAAKLIRRRHRDGVLVGQLYAIDAATARLIRMPEPCLVDDAFLAAVVATNFFQEAPDPARVKAIDGPRHLFVPPGGFLEFFRHDVRLAVGTELNAAVFSQLWKSGSAAEAVACMSELASPERVALAVREHINRPCDHALRWSKVIRRVFGPDRSVARRVALSPVLLVYLVYTVAVVLMARRMFRNGVFRWDGKAAGE